MQTAIQKGKEEFETGLVLDIDEDNPRQRWSRALGGWPLTYGPRATRQR